MVFLCIKGIMHSVFKRWFLINCNQSKPEYQNIKKFLCFDKLNFMF